MANTVQSMKTKGTDRWIATITMDSAGAVTVVPSGSFIRIDGISTAPNTATGVGLITVENADGDEWLRGWVSTGVTFRAGSSSIDSNGLVVRIGSPTSVVAVTIDFAFIGGTAIVAV